MIKRCVCNLEICIQPSFTCLQYPPPPFHSSPSWARASSSRLHGHRHTTLGRPSLDELISSTQRSQHNIHKRDIYPPCGIRTPSSSRRAAVNPRLTPRGQRDRPVCSIIYEIFGLFSVIIWIMYNMRITPGVFCQFLWLGLQ